MSDTLKKPEDNTFINKQMDEAKAELRRQLQSYLENTPRTDRKTNEFEIRFGTKSYGAFRPISKTDYDNVVRQLKTAGFYSTNEAGEQLLRIIPEFKNPKTGEEMLSNIRAEIIGIHLIQGYCETNDINKLIEKNKSSGKGIGFTQKMGQKGPDERYLKKIDFPDMNFRASWQVESEYTVRSPSIQTMISSWGDSKKVFRYMNRVRFQHNTLPVFADISIVRSSKTRRGKFGTVPIPEYTIQKANVFKNPVVYEIEFEIDNTMVGPGTAYSGDVDNLLADLRKCIRIVLSGIQQSNYPITYSERERVLKNYEKILYSKKDDSDSDSESGEKEEKGKKEEKEQHKDKRDTKKKRIPFIGPSSVPLQLENIIEVEYDDNMAVPNIRYNYTVTEKADGERALLLVNEEGLIYFIDKNMNVVFTGAKTGERKCFNSILDGEFIKYGKENRLLNLYAAFDIYFINKKTVREKAFVPLNTTEEESGELFRLPLLAEFIKALNPESAVSSKEKGAGFWKEVVRQKGEKSWVNSKTGETSNEEPESLRNSSCKLRVECKKFYLRKAGQSIFSCCQQILDAEEDSVFPYNIDGLIFTPAKTGVGSDKAGIAAEYTKGTWNLSFKWKPAHFNTVDFLVSTVKDKSGSDKVSHLYQEGIGIADGITQFKTLELRCGFDKTKHLLTNPFHSLIMGSFPKRESSQEEERNNYVPMRFVPSNPYQSDAGFTNIRLVPNGQDFIMTTEEGDYFEEDTIVEFRYDMSKESGWRWIPIRVRHDKTQKMQSGKSEFGNAYHVANDIWKSYYNPVTEDMIKTGDDIPDAAYNLDIYYNKSGDESSSKSLRNFHNLYVKKKLIVGVSNREDILIDYAVGKAGDLQKWIQARVGFVLGIDIANDNITNVVDGACTRYLNEYKYSDNIPGAIFLNGNSARNIRDGSAFSSEQHKKICKAVFGQGPKDVSLLGRGVYNQYDVAADGFHVSSCQFAVHYFFESHISLHGFLRNLAECTRLNGYFVGTCYDGLTVFNLLKGLKEDDDTTFVTDKKSKKRICTITKKYADTGFPDDELSVGYAIDVYQESINREFREYLVNFVYFQRLLENYGFTLVTRDEAKQMGLPDSTGMFGELYEQMQQEIKQDYRKKANYKDAQFMSEGEKSLSFMNRYFVFRKTTTVNAAQIERDALKKIKMVNLGNEEEVDFGDLGEGVEEERKRKAVTGKIRKLKAKVILSKGKTPLKINEVLDENEDDVLELPSGIGKPTEEDKSAEDEEQEDISKNTDKEKENIQLVVDEPEELNLGELEKEKEKEKEKEEVVENPPEKIKIRVKKSKIVPKK
jgi:hypothetical protein